MTQPSRHLAAAKAATLRAWVTLTLYTAAGVLLDLDGEAVAYYAMGLAVIGLWAAGGEALVAALSTLRHVGEGFARPVSQSASTTSTSTTVLLQSELEGS